MVRVSVITPTHGRVRSFLPACIESVARQRLLPGWELEHVVCSDNDSDEDYVALLDLAREYPHVVATRNMSDGRGVSAGRNQAFLVSSGDVVIDMDDDDVFPSTSVRDRVTHLLGSHAGWSFGGMLKMTEEGMYKLGCDLVGSAPVGQEEAMEAFLGSRLHAWLTLFREKEHSLGIDALRSGLMQSEGDKARLRWASWCTDGVPLGLPSWGDYDS